MLIDKNTIPNFDSWIIATSAGGERWIGCPKDNVNSPQPFIDGMLLSPAFTVLGNWVGDPKTREIGGKTFAVLPIEWIPSATEVEILPTSIIRMSTLSDTDRGHFMKAVIQAKELVKQMSAAQSGLVLPPTNAGGLIK